MSKAHEEILDISKLLAGFKTNLDLPPLVSNEPPYVLIAGAGLGGLFLGILLERIGIPYTIYERASVVTPLGSIICLSPNILPVFEQLGLYDELMSFSKPTLEIMLYADNLKVLGQSQKNSSAETQDKIGYNRILHARPDLYDFLLKQIPCDKIHFSKKVLSFQQFPRGVTVRFSDNSVVHGDILVGADGAHSAVRQHLYKILKKEGKLPKNDTKPMTKGYISVVSTTEPLNPFQFPGVLREDSESAFVIGDKKTPYTWVTFTVPRNRICWSVIIQIGTSELADEQFRSSDWVPQQNQKFLDSIRHFKIPNGTMGDLFDVTPIECVSKLLPSSGAGAVNAMQDAVLLANHIYDIYPTSFENIEKALHEYREERFDSIREQYPQSYMGAKLIYGHTLSERILQKIVFNYLPNNMKDNQLLRDTAYRPQANFLPPAPKRGTMNTIGQKPSKRLQKKSEEADTGGLTSILIV
ncbi:hypothetical protein FBU30_000492 [Linnemannia zychae]|nr:hypothetical protein FBU30_000492 [Linnemannia zychae]